MGKAHNIKYQRPKLSFKYFLLFATLSIEESSSNPPSCSTIAYLATEALTASTIGAKSWSPSPKGLNLNWSTSLWFFAFPSLSISAYAAPALSFWQVKSLKWTVGHLFAYLFMYLTGSSPPYLTQQRSSCVFKVSSSSVS